MRNRRRAATVALLLALAAVFVAAWLRDGVQTEDPSPTRTPTPTSTAAGDALVAWIADGDTLDVSIDGSRRRVRLLNIDAPERGHAGTPDQCLAAESRAALAALAPVGSPVRLVTYGHDRFGRLLAGVHTPDGTLVNAELVRRGLAAPFVVGGDTRLLSVVLDARDEAAAAASGLHSPEVACTIPGRLAAAYRELANAQGADAGALAAARRARDLAEGVVAHLDADARDSVVAALAAGQRDRSRADALRLRGTAVARIVALEASGVR